ncbi:hypothetical protein CN290_23720 [Bacillus cereus]|uniref:Integrase catalytic domain-containing protein n=1 Tax=Bacillus cereus TaxID=1396 RepID=A0A2B1IC75_BACCE|nr:IS3 family transposase [Bacillus cereus]PFC71089.1 hypothetical protein CN290_23720 [Bacillus cereus]PFM97111.1 hypothetical protein COJ65_28640 [Bacillus cereus]
MKRMVIKFFMLYYSEHKKTASQLLDISNDWEAVFSIKKYKYSFHTADEVKFAVRKYIHFYNHQRLQKKLNNLSPYKYRTQVA